MRRLQLTLGLAAAFYAGVAASIAWAGLEAGRLAQALGWSGLAALAGLWCAEHLIRAARP